MNCTFEGRLIWGTSATAQHVWIKLGQAQAAAGKTEQATSTYRHALKDNPQEPDFYVLLGQHFQSHQHRREAENSYQKALEISQE
jgi:Tfp pilus assembly protein PilF